MRVGRGLEMNTQPIKENIRHDRRLLNHRGKYGALVTSAQLIRRFLMLHPDLEKKRLNSELEACSNDESLLEIPKLCLIATRPAGFY